ncbi:MAG TPA: hypothetical protein VFB44_09250 [Thermoleophilaceae bacterium]|nr:hypothetical protein [Thermoleophilaceae bacterium]
MSDATITPPFPRARPGSYRTRAEAYPSALEFGLAVPVRAGSHERDVGLGWCRDGVLYRCAVVLATREVYLCQLGPPDSGGGHVRVLGTLPPGRTINDVFDGWAEAHGAPDSLDWLLGRATALDGPAAAPQAGVGAGSASASPVREASRLSRRPING